MSEYWYIERGLLILDSNYFILENGNGIQVYQELVIFNHFVQFKSLTFNFLITSPENENYPILGPVTFQFQSDWYLFAISFFYTYTTTKIGLFKTCPNPELAFEMI